MAKSITNKVGKYFASNIKIYILNLQENQITTFKILA